MEAALKAPMSTMRPRVPIMIVTHRAAIDPRKLMKNLRMVSIGLHCG